MDGVLTACVWVLVAFALVVVVLALRQPVVAAPQGALASIGVPRAAGPLRDLPVLPRTGGFADRTRPVDLGALRRAVATRIDGRFSASRSAELLRYLRGQPLRPSTDSSAYGVAAYP